MRISDWSSDVCSSDLQIAFIASRQAVSPRAEDHEGRRPRPRLRDIAQLDALAPRRRRRIILDRAFEPAVEPRGRHAVRPDFALLERGAHQRIDALARRARNGEHGHALDLAEPVVERVRSEEHTSELQSLMRISYAVF